MNADIAAAAPATNFGERPVEVTNAIKLAALNFLVGWIAIAISWDYISALYPSPTMLVVNQVFSTAIIVWIYYKIYHGRNWARILLVVFSVLGFAMTFNSMVAWFIASAPIVTKISMAFGLAVNLTVMWLLFISKGRLWFGRRPNVSASSAPNATA